MEFKFINQSEKSAALFEKNPAWASYYEPDDIDAIAKWGINRDEIVEKLKAIDYSGDYIFPLLSIENEYPFKFEYYKAKFETPSGEELEGYTVGTRVYAIGVFTEKDHYVLNLNLKNHALKDEKEILKDIHSKSSTIFPLKVTITAMGLSLSGEFDPSAK